MVHGSEAESEEVKSRVRKCIQELDIVQKTIARMKTWMRKAASNQPSAYIKTPWTHLEFHKTMPTH